MHCPECGSKNTIKDYRDIPFTYKGQSTVVKAVGADWCLDCGEGVIFKEESLRIDSILTEFNKQVNASIIDPEYVVAMRKKLNLSQSEAGEIFGGGVNAFSRYETGKALPHVSTIKLLKLLDKYPELLEEIRN
ncbi:MAG: type II toxin-antitoxin system MqsA family antitoxin [Enterobacterales bacterium]|jgi:HTH-type transcriptional regulator/antitoxin MqsA|uniref:YgiT-type zinc finger protein n=1 Tax=Hafnia alvei TaxID=569 RepID=A0ABD7PYX9_HAFAL|nr:MULTISPECIES: type II TA system antitoxin MqsA family protein [Hafniaceae]MDN5471880.1 type II toxin-antitoxin system MqsA family antitoxin [Enterobacterales bacterium]KAA0261467.1 YgiT-type zinc finger protein [Hafnia alvei]MDN5968934.1 type II toxin-antitoxin system MqsA family antitoxin [Enterobacterales bacterium]MDN6072128.1 type II toxin-antitoxin system MqsA family antitoxin [Enterobacterales bacterium]MDN6110493.1 type II toxin-antitoxin system MqsA family antitoxin [Enterobacterale